MGNIFELDDDIKQVIQDAMDDLLANSEVGGLGKTCKLVYPPKYTFCTNCVVDPLSGRSTGNYKSGGPIPFNSGPCPLCGGQARIPIETSETITLLCNWDYRKFITPIPRLLIKTPDSMVETRGYLTDMPKVEQADYMLLQTPISGFGTRRYKLWSEPGDRSNIVQGRYFICVWRRFDG